MNQDVFERYFKYRCDQAGAVTPGQQLAVLAQLRREAEQEGRVPVSETNIAQVDLHSPAVQSVLRGEPVSLGAQTVAAGKKSSFPLFASKGSGMARLSTPAKVAILLGIVILPAILLPMLFGRSKKAAPAPLPTATPPALAATAAAAAPSPSATPADEDERTPRPTSGQMGGLPASADAASGSENPAASGGFSVQTEDQLIYVPMDNKAAQEAVAPASIELGSKHFVIQIGALDEESGIWEPQGGVEWLPTTYVRKVIAIPESFLKDINFQEGDIVRLRYRDGFTATYTLTRVIPDLLTDRIEILNGTTPSLAIVAYTNELRDPRRMVLLAEMALPDSYQPVVFQQPAPTPASPAATPTPASERRAVIAVDNVNLRSGPSMYAPVKALLSRLTEVTIHTEVPQTEADGYTWLFITTPEDGDGWVADYLVIPQE